MKTVYLSITLAFLAIFHGCTDIAGTGGEGNGSETIARGVIVDSMGVPAADVPVQLLPVDYNPAAGDSVPATLRAHTDSRGEYRLSSAITPGTYALEAGSAALKALVRNIEVTAAETNVAVDTATLHKTGTIIIKLTDLPPQTGDYVYLPGTSTFTEISASDSTTGQTILHDVPAGLFTDVIYSSSDGSSTTDLMPDTLRIIPGDTVTSAYAAWARKRKVVLNTTASGADIGENVHNFPVLIRLKGTTFEFTQAQNGGEDIRFAKPDGTALAYEIERWDATSEQAEIWVRVDTVFGNNSEQYLTMYWGNPAAHDLSNSAAVFDTSQGFEGVWHLQSSTATISDATGNGHNGTRNGDQSRAAGYIGYGQLFDGSGDYSEMADMANPDTSGFTVSAWIRHGVSKQRQTIISKSRGGLPSPSYGWLVVLDENGALQAFTASDTGVWGDPHTFDLTSNTVITDTSGWHHIAVIIDRSGNSNCHLFLDGADVTIPTGGDITTVGSVANDFPMLIGSDNGGGDTKWKGLIDECTVSRRVRSTGWIRLSYMNQREDNALVEFR